ncbi:hypothetical protein AC579_945 [Pseudocercospora musae]|uniref:Signal peptidase complex catalytic subunit SEC11 n=1 Tax=Pseudocercospora musae TaxID=113226 RepID=A0A139IUS6_9PEZI|nr:hypothetical protein AC579_945 [Pseudocercospora musae]
MPIPHVQEQAGHVEVSGSVKNPGKSSRVNSGHLSRSQASLIPQYHILNFALVLSTAFMLWKGFMEPAFQRGDLLFLWNRGLDTQVGEVVVYSVKGKDIPIVHRVIRRFGGGGSAPLQLLTKGDNNAADDTELYARGQSYLDRSKDVIGSVFAYVPLVGYVTILLSEYPWLKTVMLVFMAATVVLQRE